jgi:hypothetical protein
MMTRIFDEAKSLSEYVLPSTPGSEKSGARAPMARGVGSATANAFIEAIRRRKDKQVGIFLIIRRFRYLKLLKVADLV